MFVHCSALLPNSCPCNAVHPMQCLVERKRETFLCNIGFVLQTVSLVKSVLNKCWMMIASYYSGPRFHFKKILDTLLLGLVIRHLQFSMYVFRSLFRSDGQQLPRLAFAICSSSMMITATKVGVYTTQTETGTVRWHNQLL